MIFREIRDTLNGKNTELDIYKCLHQGMEISPQHFTAEMNLTAVTK